MHFREKPYNNFSLVMSTITEKQASIPFSERLEGWNIGTPKYLDINFRSETMYISLLGFAPAGWLPRKITNLVRFSVFTYKKYKVYFTNNISAVTRVMLPVDFHIYLKLQSVSFASLSPSLFENLELQLFEELSSLCGCALARLQRRWI